MHGKNVRTITGAGQPAATEAGRASAKKRDGQPPASGQATATKAQVSKPQVSKPQVSKPQVSKPQGSESQPKRQPGKPAPPPGKDKSAGRSGARASKNAARIRDIALDLFAQKSFSAVTIKEIGQAAGLNTAMIYYYFDDKEDLFRDTVETAVQRAMEAFESRRAPEGDPEAVVTNWLETHIEQIDLIRKFVKISVDYASSDARVDRIDEAIKRFYEGEHHILADALRTRTGERFTDSEIDRQIELFSTYLDGVMVRSIIAPGFDAEAAIRSLLDYILTMMRGSGG
ncbi:HTH-type transcriptional regulator AcrR [Methyloligella halotolerans]|uniref:HTH-type transcriptional regulator AcrR n=1 Tax=Methyloligella halotolerans TaxID=1177755 RepID=A0A1E2S0C8_9HYPH|nr:TetR/AcrR family transcriptional regulator [Methyloligella halotolerans]ODA67953.1 HTH-type transcriptional regulator AcrR [Methyloligella halotolerans]